MISSSASTRFLKKYYERKKRAQPRYSLRALARDLGCSPSYVSTILDGKRSLPVGKLSRLSKILKLDEFETAHLEKLLSVDVLQKKGLTQTGQAIESSTEPFSRFNPVEPSQQNALKHWYLLPLLDLTTCANFDSNPKSIALRLGITESQVRSGISDLIEMGLLTSQGETLQKTQNAIRFPSKGPSEETRNYHHEMLKRATSTLLEKRTAEDFESRLISGITLAANPNQLQKAKERLNQALHEISIILSQGECTEVYQLNTQLFSLTNQSKN